MLHRLRSYIRQHHIAFLALFAALGGGGAYAASLGGGTIRGFNQTVTKTQATDSGTLAKLGGLALKFRSKSLEDLRTCTLSAKASDAGQLSGFSAEKILSGGSGKSFDVRSRSLKAGGTAVVGATHADAGAPDVSRTLEGHLTWHNDKTGQVVTSVFHVSAETPRCRFQGTLTGAG
jgi:hypothetical protein